MEPVLSDQLIMDKFKKHLEPDESELYYVFGQQGASSLFQVILLPILGLLLAPLTAAVTTRNFFIGLTNQRLLLMRVSLTYDEKDLKSIKISEIGGVKVEDSPMDKTIHFILRTGEKCKFKVKKSLHAVENQKENLEKICQLLTV